MYLSRTRKAPAQGGAGRSRSLSKAVGDAPTTTTQKKMKSENKSAIPKEVRYDLENALVGLCDVWFEDIKPYLVQNNIKVHVTPRGGGAGAGGAATQAGGDRCRALPTCSHQDPGAALNRCRQPTASCADYSTTQATASTARYPKLPPPQWVRHPAVPHPSKILSIPEETPRLSYEKGVRSERKRPRGVALRARRPRPRPPRPARRSISESANLMTPVTATRLNRTSSDIPPPPRPPTSHRRHAPPPISLENLLTSLLVGKNTTDKSTQTVKYCYQKLCKLPGMGRSAGSPVPKNRAGSPTQPRPLSPTTLLSLSWLGFTPGSPDDDARLPKEDPHFQNDRIAIPVAGAACVQAPNESARSLEYTDTFVLSTTIKTKNKTPSRPPWK